MVQVAAIVTQPPSRRDRGRKVLPSPLAEYAIDRGFPSNLIFTPERAGEVIIFFYLVCGCASYEVQLQKSSTLWCSCSGPTVLSL